MSEDSPITYTRKELQEFFSNHAITYGSLDFSTFTEKGVNSLLVLGHLKILSLGLLVITKI
jgi:hypothetical protein